jgi:hypothetical protein
MLLTLMVNGILNEPPDWETWLLLLGVVGLAIFMLLMTWDTWKKVVCGIVVRETGLSINGYEISWEDIEGVYTNPNLHYVSIRLSRPHGIRKNTMADIQKESISQWKEFFEHVAKLGTVVKQENLA